jgi:hypothetical protein
MLKKISLYLSLNDLILYLNEFKQSKYLNDAQNLFWMIQSFELWKFSNKKYCFQKFISKNFCLSAIIQKGFTKVYKIPP